MTNQLTKKELNKIYLKSFELQLGWNYQVMQGLGYAAAMSPIIEKNYHTLEEKAEALEVYMDFYNCNPHTSTTIMGANVALEEQLPGDFEAIRSLKLSLMGPLSSLGDTLIVAVWGSIVFAITGTLALSGSSFAFISAFIPALFYAIPLMVLRYKLFNLGHNLGQDMFVKYANEFEMIKKFGYIFGLIVIGGLAATMVNVTLTNDLMIGEVKIDLNNTINSIVPGMLSLVTVLLAYWSLGLKKMNSTRLLLATLVIATALGAFGILV